MPLLPYCATVDIEFFKQAIDAHQLHKKINKKLGLPVKKGSQKYQK